MKPNRDTSTIQARLGIRIRSLRESQHLTQERFALMIGLDRTYINGIERGKRNVSLTNIARIAEGLGITISELFDGVD